MKNVVIKSFYGNVRKLVRYVVSFVFDIYVIYDDFLMLFIYYFLNCCGKIIFFISFRMVFVLFVFNNIIYMYFIFKMFNIFGFL